MATAQKMENDESLFKCAICQENYHKPRYLTSCRHAFCEICLHRYVTNLHRRNEIGRQFKCPVCQHLQDLPADCDLDATPDWVERFPLDKVIMELMVSSPEAEKNSVPIIICDRCAEHGETQRGSQYCINCLEVLCQRCSSNHTKYKHFEFHKLVDAKDLSPEERREKVLIHLSRCTKHPDREFQFYSKKYDRLLCNACLNEPNARETFRDAIEISTDGIDMVHLAEEVAELTKQLKVATDHLNHLQKVRKDNKGKVKLQANFIKDNIVHIRQDAIALYDNIVKYVTEKADTLESEAIARFDKDIDRVSRIIMLSDQKSAHLESIANHGTDKQKFIATHLIKEQLEKMELKMSEEDASLVKMNIKVKLAPDVAKVSAKVDVKTIAEVRLTESESMLHRYSSYFLATNELTDKRLAKVEEKYVNPRGKFPPKFIGISMLLDERLVLCDARNGLLCIYDPSNEGFVKSRLVDRPSKAVPLDNKHLAISSPEDKSISFLTLTPTYELTIQKQFRMRSPPTTIATIKHNQLAVFQFEPYAVCILDVDTKTWQINTKVYFEQDSSGRRFKSLDHIAVDEKRGHIIQPCRIDRAVHCFDLCGKPVFRYSGVSLKEPRGAAVDKCGNIYVCDQLYNIVHKLSPTGKVVCIISERIPRNPLAICSDPTGQYFWLTQDDEGRTVFLYHVQ